MAHLDRYHGNAPPQGRRDLEADHVVGPLAAAKLVEPLVPDRGQEHVTLAHPLRNVGLPVDADRDTLDVIKDVVAAKLTHETVE
jgi:hypothetical protein